MGHRARTAATSARARVAVCASCAGTAACAGAAHSTRSTLRGRAGSPVCDDPTGSARRAYRAAETPALSPARSPARDHRFGITRCTGIGDAIVLCRTARHEPKSHGELRKTIECAPRRAESTRHGEDLSRASRRCRNRVRTARGFNLASRRSQEIVFCRVYIARRWALRLCCWCFETVDVRAAICPRR